MTNSAYRGLDSAACSISDQNRILYLEFKENKFIPLAKYKYKAA
jgi:hypothetical protein